MIRYFLRFPPGPSGMTVTTQLLRIGMNLSLFKTFPNEGNCSAYKLKQSMNGSVNLFSHGVAPFAIAFLLEVVRYALISRFIF